MRKPTPPSEFPCENCRVLTLPSRLTTVYGAVLCPVCAAKATRGDG